MIRYGRTYYWGIYGWFLSFWDFIQRTIRSLRAGIVAVYSTILILNWEKRDFIVQKGIVLRHLILARGIEVDRAKYRWLRNYDLQYQWRKSEASSITLNSHRFIKDFSRIRSPFPTCWKMMFFFTFLTSVWLIITL